MVWGVRSYILVRKNSAGFGWTWFQKTKWFCGLGAVVNSLVRIFAMDLNKMRNVAKICVSFRIVPSADCWT